MDEGWIPGYRITYENSLIGASVSWCYDIKDKESQIDEVNGIKIVIANEETNKIFLSYLKKNFKYSRECERYNTESDWCAGIGISNFKEGEYSINYVW